jgi:hypothetical protein
MPVRALAISEPIASIIFSGAAVSVLGSAVLLPLVPGQLPEHRLPPVVWGLLAAIGALACCLQVGR